MSILVPEIVNAGDTVIFDVPAFNDSIGTQIDSASYTLTWYARTDKNHEGATITGVAESDGWRVTVPSSVTQVLMLGCGLGKQLHLWVQFNTRQAEASTPLRPLLATQGSLVHLTIVQEQRLIWTL